MRDPDGNGGDSEERGEAERDPFAGLADALHAFAILPQDLEIDNPINIKSEGRVQLPDSAALAAVT
jgi:hypothetical protein